MNEDPSMIRVQLPMINADDWLGARPIFGFKDPTHEALEHRELWLKLQRLEALYPWPRKAATKLRLPTKEGTL